MVVHVITVVPCGVPKTDGEMKPSTKLQELREALKKYGGEAVLPILYGDATVKTSPAMDPDQGPFDICITSHPSVQSYVIATESHLYQVAAKNTKILTFGFSNQTMWNNYIFPAMKKTYQFAKTKVPEKIPLVDLEIKATKPAKYDLIQANSEKGISAYKKRINHKMYQSFYLISFITKDESKEGKEKEREYAKSWLPAAFSSDLNKCFGGELASLDDGPKTFGEVSVFEFPSREKYVDWMESEYHTKLAEEESGFVLNKFVAIGVPVYG